MIVEAKTHRWVPEPPRLRRLSRDWSMRAVGRAGVLLNALVGSRECGPLGILTFHRVAPRQPRLPFPLHNVTPQAFREQVTGLMARGFHVVSLREALACHASGASLPPWAVVLTFDDGFESVYLNAWPVLREMKIPASIFVNTAYLGSPHPFPFDAWGVAFQQRAPAESYRPLTLRQCREMVASGLVEIGAHTHTHEDFRGRPDAFRHDLLHCVEIVRSTFGLGEVTFAFPYGSPFAGFANEELVDAAKQTGVACGLTTESVLVDLKHDPFRWGRLNVFPWDTSATLTAKLHGWYSWAGKLKRAGAQCVAAALATRGDVGKRIAMMRNP